jgi:hypothetical protein
MPASGFPSVVPSPTQEGFDNLRNRVALNGVASLSTGSRYGCSRSMGFPRPAEPAVITVVQVLRHGMPLLYVTHDAHDGGSQFLTGKTLDVEDAMVVGLEEMIRHDPTLAALADLPIGWCAWREGRDAKWQRGPRSARLFLNLIRSQARRSELDARNPADLPNGCGQFVDAL